MKKLNIFILILIMLLGLFGVSSSKLLAATAPAQNVKTEKAKVADTPKKEPVTYTYTAVKPLDLVKNPNAYMNKRVKITGKFDKFSSLGLDYKPAMRSSEKYIAFLIRRDDAQNDIPLSELKNFMKREMAEKYIDLETDDLIEYSGLVFSNALGDAWLDVEEFKIISSKSTQTKTK
ncbi:hypothetical protein IJ843_06760 [bacterium]|nr:hypothetical protein [bacterium]